MKTYIKDNLGKEIDTRVIRKERKQYKFPYKLMSGCIVLGYFITLFVNNIIDIIN